MNGPALDARGLADAVAQVVELGAPDFALVVELDLGEQGAVERDRPLCGGRDVLYDGFWKHVIPSPSNQVAAAAR